MDLRFELLGPIRAWIGDTEVDLGASKQRAVLAMLLLNIGRPVATTAIVDGVWENDPPENGSNVVQKYVAGLRRVLEPERSPRSAGGLITLSNAGYVLSPSAGSVDSAVFQQRVQEANQLRWHSKIAEAAVVLQEADAMWKGEPLAGLSGQVFETARSSLLESRGAARETWAELELALGHHTSLVPRLVELIGAFPLREGLRYHHILALYRCGRQAEALEAYRETHRLLATEFAIEPGARLQELHRRILNADPGLTLGSGKLSTRDRAVPSPLPPHVTAYAVPVPAPSTTVSRSTLLGFLGVVVPLVTCGAASWAVMAFFAAYRRSWWVALSAVAYLGLTIVLCADIFEENSAVGMFAVPALLVTFFGGSLQGALLGFGVPKVEPDAAMAYNIAAQARRDVARHLVHAEPATAWRLNIGRPMLPRHFDDGGLLDLNVAPPEMLVALGLSPHWVQSILADRYQRGPLNTLEELIARNVLPVAELERIREFALVYPPMPEPVQAPVPINGHEAASVQAGRWKAP